ncbi:Ras GTPase ras2 [Ascosphaera pollenicola]|nr:Ras GTPase ras2 [Ascosphaera pollenicola]
MHNPADSRYSPEDHATLEREYLRDPKPNKVARAEIVQKVSMNDREVQIWFQNRRQNDRRKAKDFMSRSKLSDVTKRPLAPRPEQAAPSGTETLGSDLATFESQFSSSDSLSPSMHDAVAGLLTPDQSHEKNETSVNLLPSNAAEASAGPSVGALGSAGPEGVLLRRTAGGILSATASTPAAMTEQTPTPMTNPTQFQRKLIRGNNSSDRFDCTHRPNSVTFPLAPALLAPALRISFSPDGEAIIRGQNEPSPVSSPVNPRGAVRISMSADGKACVCAESDESPAKISCGSNNIIINNAGSATAASKETGTAAAAAAAARPPLRRSASAFTLNCLRNEREDSTPLKFDGSRDLKLWDTFYDHDNRSTISKPSASSAQQSLLLQHQQQQRNQGQAFVPTTPTPAATTRMTKPRGRRKLQRASTVNTASPQKRRALAPRNGNQKQGASTEGPLKKRSKLSRATSSLARLEGTNPVAGKPPRRNNKGSDLLEHSGDSDKENWEPGTRPFSSWRRYSDARGSARDGTASHARAGNYGPSYYDHIGDLSEHEAGGHGGDDVRQHLSQSSRDSEPADIDCIQGLLSLSQGAWR